MLGAIGDHLWQSTIFAAVAALLTFALRHHQARVRHLVWLTASVKFLVPFVALAAIGRSVVWHPTAALATPDIPAAIDALSQPFTSALTTVAPDPLTNSPPTALLPLALAAMWLAGVFVHVAWWALRWQRVSAIVRGAPLIDCGRTFELLRRLEHKSGAKTAIPLVTPDTSLEPGIYGLFRPVLIWPRRLTEHLSDTQTIAILEHELTHVRRRDNLAAAIHRSVAILCWFHPLVWWIGARLAEEQERACDEEVLARGSQPDDYAAAILTTCRFCIAAPPGVAGVSGQDLRRRIEAIVRNDTPAALTRAAQLLLVSAVMVTIVAALMSGPRTTAVAQQADASDASFEVAAIRPNRSGSSDLTMQIQPGGRVTITNASVRLLVRQAYRVQDFQIVGGPSWFGTDRFDILAKAPGNPSGSQMQDMLRRLLSDRFRLAVRNDTREMPLYALVTARGDRRLGPRLHVAQPCFRAPNNLPPQNVPAGETPCGFRLRAGWVGARGVTMPALAGTLANQVSRFVVDRTGLTGEFDVELEWTPFQRSAGLDAPAAADDRPADSGPSIFTALQEQLGLKLESDRGPVDVLIIERVEPPTPD